jgi:uncharacterized membrane protein YgdD (TMEM256/DUF423 family)
MQANHTYGVKTRRIKIIKLYLNLLKIGPVLFSGEIHAIKLKGNEIVLQTLVDIFLG